ncbi:MAG: SRPBCC family protein [Candidatus Ranarchaeia archaeon]
MEGEQLIIKDTRVTRTIDVPAPLEVVWKILTDFEAFPEIDPVFQKVEFLTKQKQGIGTTTLWKFTKPDQTLVERVEIITEFKPMEYYTYRVLTGAPPKDCTLIFQPIEEGVRIIFTELLNYENPNVEKVGEAMFAELQMVQKKAKRLLDNKNKA